MNYVEQISDYKDFIDVDLTKSIIDNEVSQELKWLPFIGKQYLNSAEKILIVGKMNYNEVC